MRFFNIRTRVQAHIEARNRRRRMRERAREYNNIMKNYMPVRAPIDELKYPDNGSTDGYDENFAEAVIRCLEIQKRR